MAEKKAEETKDGKVWGGLRRKLRVRLTEYARAHMSGFRVVDDVTWVLSGAFVLAFLFWFQEHPYGWAIGLGLLVLVVKLVVIVINPNRKVKKEEEP